MKRFAAVSLAALMVLAVFASCASAADSVEIRGPVYNGTNLDEILGGDDLVMNANNFAAFYFDLDDGVFTETLTIKTAGKDDPTTGNTIPEGALVYSTEINYTDFDYDGNDWTDADGETVTQYPILGFFAEEFIPIENGSADKLAELVLDDDDKYTLRTGEILDLGEGYALEAKQVDVEGDKVWLEFTKDGEFVDDEIISVVEGETGNWEVELDDIEDEDDVIVMRVHVNQVFQGAVDSIAQIEGLWLIDYENAFTIESDDEFGELEVTVSGATLNLESTDDITLNKDDTEDIAEDMAFLIADDDNYLRFYVFKEFTEPGTYEIRGQVVENTVADYEWDASSFAGFYYDIDDDVKTETLNITGASVGDESVEIDENELAYSTTIGLVDFDYDGDDWEDADGETVTQYPVLGFFAEPYIPIEYGAADKLAKLVLDDDEKYTLRTGEILDLGEGYALEAKQVDVEGDKVWLEFTKDGEFVDDEIISVVEGETGNWEVELDDIEDEDDVIVMRVHVNQVFQGAVDSIAQIEGLWLIDYENAFTIESDDAFGELEVTVSGDTLNLKNDDTITLNKDDTEDIAEGIAFKIADTDSGDVVRFYPFVEVTIEGAEEDEPVDEPVEEPVVDEPVDDGNVTVDEPVVDEPVDDGNVTDDEEPAEDDEDEGEEEPDTPGFGFAFGLVGLLAVVYLVRRND